MNIIIFKRGVSVTFGLKAVDKFLSKYNLELICRAHQVVEDGYDFMFDRKVLTLFSAPNYCGEFDNAGAMMIVDEALKCSFKILRPAVHKSKFPEQYPNYTKGDKTDGLLDEAPDRESMYAFLHESQDAHGQADESDQNLSKHGNEIEQIREVSKDP